MVQSWKEENQELPVTNREYRPADQQPKLTGKRPETKEIDNVRKILLGTLMEK